MAGLLSSTDGLGDEVFNVSQDGEQLTANFTDRAGNAVMVDLTFHSGTLSGTITVQEPAVGGPACIGKAYVVNNFANTVSVIDLATNTVIGSPIPVGSNPRGLDISPDGSLVFVPNRDADTVTVIRTSDDTVVTTIPITGFGEPYNIVFAPNGATAYVVNKNGDDVSVIDVATLTETSRISLSGSSPEGVAITPDGSKLYVVNRGSNTVDVILAATNTLGATGIPVGSAPRDAQVLPNGSRVYVVSEGGTTVISTATDTVLGSLAGSGRDVEASPDSTRVYVAAGPSTALVRVIDATTDTLLPSISLGTGGAYGIDLCGNASTAYVSDDSSRVAIVDLLACIQVPTITVGNTPKSVKILEQGTVGTGRRVVAAMSAIGRTRGNARTVDGTMLITSDSGGGCRGTEFTIWAMLP